MIVKFEQIIMMTITSFQHSFDRSFYLHILLLHPHFHSFLMPSLANQQIDHLNSNFLPFIGWCVMIMVTDHCSFVTRRVVRKE